MTRIEGFKTETVICIPQILLRNIAIGYLRKINLDYYKTSYNIFKDFMNDIFIYNYFFNIFALQQIEEITNNEILFLFNYYFFYKYEDEKYLDITNFKIGDIKYGRKRIL